MPDWGLDFDGVKRAPRGIGAYAGNAAGRGLEPAARGASLAADRRRVAPDAARTMTGSCIMTAGSARANVCAIDHDTEDCGPARCRGAHGMLEIARPVDDGPFGRSPPAAPPVAAPPTPAHEDAGIAWRKGDVDAAFVAAKAEGKPVFLYWGATWCPPCNQVKATIFNRQDFIERSRHFIPVYIDGDAPNAQKEGVAVQGQRLSDDGPVHARRCRDHAPARRGRRRAIHACSRDGHEQRAAGEGHARRGACRRFRRQADAPKTGACSLTIPG